MQVHFIGIYHVYHVPKTPNYKVAFVPKKPLCPQARSARLYRHVLTICVKYKRHSLLSAKYQHLGIVELNTCRWHAPHKVCTVYD